MREFTDKSRFTVRSIPEVVEQIAVLVARYRARGVSLDGRFSREILVNSLFLHFAALPPGEQQVVLDDGLARLRALLSEGELAAGPPGPSGPGSAPAQGAAS